MFEKLFFRFLLFGSYFVIFFIIFAAKTRGIGIPNDLETEIIAIINRSKLVLKHTRHWMSHRQRRDSIIITVSKDYRNIIEGLQVKIRLDSDCLCWLCLK